MSYSTCIILSVNDNTKEPIKKHFLEEKRFFIKNKIRSPEWSLLKRVKANIGDVFIIVFIHNGNKDAYIFTIKHIIPKDATHIKKWGYGEPREGTKKSFNYDNVAVLSWLIYIKPYKQLCDEGLKSMKELKINYKDPIPGRTNKLWQNGYLGFYSNKIPLSEDMVHILSTSEGYIYFIRVRCCHIKKIDGECDLCIPAVKVGLSARTVKQRLKEGKTWMPFGGDILNELVINYDDRYKIEKIVQKYCGINTKLKEDLNEELNGEFCKLSLKQVNDIVNSVEYYYE